MTKFKKLVTFIQLVKNHDLTYIYSDDISVYSKGNKKYEEILTLATEINDNVVIDIWNCYAKLKTVNSDIFIWKSKPTIKIQQNLKHDRNYHRNNILR